MSGPGGPCNGVPPNLLLSCGFSVNLSRKRRVIPRVVCRCPSTALMPRTPTPLPGTTLSPSTWKRASLATSTCSPATPGRTPSTTAPTSSPLSSLRTAASATLRRPTPSTTSAIAGSPAAFSRPPHKGGDSSAQLLERFHVRSAHRGLLRQAVQRHHRREIFAWTSASQARPRL